MSISSERLRRRAADGDPSRTRGKTKKTLKTGKIAKTAKIGRSSDEARSKLATKSRAVGSAASATRSRAGVGAATRSRGNVEAETQPNRAPLIVGGLLIALAALGGASYFALSGPDRPNTTEVAKKPDAAPAISELAKEAPAVAANTPLDRAKKVVSDAQALENAKRESDAVNALDAALDEGWPIESKKILADARAAIFGRFKARIADAQALVARGDLTQARAVLGALKPRCPDSLAPSLVEVESRLNGAIARADRNETPSARPAETPALEEPKAAETPKAPEPPRRDSKPEQPPAKKPDAKDDKAKKALATDLASRIRMLLLEQRFDGKEKDNKVAEAAKLIPELESLAPDAPSTHAVRGLVLFAERKYDECQEDLAIALAADAKDEPVRLALATSYFLYGHYEEARELAKDQKDSDLERLVYLIDGPWAEQFPLAHAALEGRSGDGHYAILTDLGPESGAISGLEKELEKSPDRRAFLLDKFKKGHSGLKECERHFEAAYKAYCKLFKVKEEKNKESRIGGEPKKDGPKKDGSTVAREGGNKELKLPVNHGRVARVFIFKDQTDFATFSRKLGIGSTEHILGYFMPSVKILAFYRQESREGTLITKELHNVLFHETFHQFLDLFIADAPPWFNEGMAEYFGISELTPSGLRYGLIPDGTHGGSRYTNLQEVISPVYKTLYGGTCPKLFSLMKLSHSDFMVNGAANYAMGWGLVHYFASTKPGQKKLKIYFRSLRDGVSHEEAFKRAFADVDQERLEADFRAHVGDMAFNRPPPDDPD